MFKKWIVLILSIAFVLTACHSPLYNQTEGNIADVKIRAAQLKKHDDIRARQQTSLVVKPDAYVDRTPVAINHRPSWLSNHIVIRGSQLPFAYFTRLIAAGAGSQVLVKYQPRLDQNVNVSMNYSGTVQGALDLLATKSGNVYSVTANKVYWQSFITRTFDIAFLPGDSDYMVGKSKSSGTTQASSSSGTQTTNYTTSDPSNDEYSNLSGKISIWKDLKDTVTQMMSPDGKLSVSQSATSITVVDRPTNIELIGQYVANLNTSLSKQVLVKIQVLEIDLTNAFNYGIDWNIVTTAFANTNFQINAQYGTPISLSNILPNPNVPSFGTVANGSGLIPSYQILIKALNQQGKTAIVSEPRTLCQNNQVCVVRITRNQGYIASIENTSSSNTTGGAQNNNNSVTSQVTPGVVVTGFTLYVLPKIIKDKVYLSVNADISTLIQLRTFGTPTTTAASSQVELPDVTEKHFNQRSMIRSGDTLILSGLKTLRNVSGAAQFLTSQALGGTTAAQTNSETIILITPIILNGKC